MTRVAFVAGTAAGGTAAHVTALATGCQDLGLEVAILAPPAMITRSASVRRSTRPASSAVPARGRRDHAELVPLAISDRPRPACDARAIAALRSFIARWRPDVVHAHGVRAGAFAAIAIALTRRPARPPLVVTSHNAPPPGRPAALLYGALERICARRADVVLCASGDLLARMTRAGAHAERFDVAAVPAGPPTPEQVAAARAAVSADGRPVVLAVGRLTRQKGFDVLIDAAARWRDRRPEPVTVIAGGGPLEAGLRARARSAGGDVRLLGPRDDVPALLALAHVVVVPSRWEARALVVQEAMRAGRPIVAARVGGIPELTGADGALLVPAGDAAALAAGVTAVLDDAALAARLSSAARQKASAFPTSDDAVQAVTERYARLAGGTGLPRTVP